MPLIGWGLDDVAGFFANGWRAALWVMAIGMIVVAVAVIRRIASEGGLGKGIEEKRIKRQSPIRWVLGALMLALFLLAPNGDRNHYARLADVSWIRPLGVLLTGWGYAFLLWSSAVLGKQLSGEVTIQEGHELITTGPYGWIRHPRYLFIVVSLLGYGLAFGSWLGFVFAPVVLAVFLFRIHDEERLLATEFGDQWRAYAQRSWRLVPFVY